MLSRDAQDAMYQYELADHHRLAGSKTFTEVDRATKAGAKFYELTFEVVQADENRGAKRQGPSLQQIIKDAVTSRR